MFILFTDFGHGGPYVGELHLQLARLAPGVPVVDLMHDVPAFDIAAGAHLLAALVARFHCGDVVIAVVDPGVGTVARAAAALRADGRWYIGPDNGLFDVVAARAKHHLWHRITWRPESLSASFHGRDLFAPFAASLATGTPLAARPLPERRTDRLGVGAPAPRIIYIDGFGNAVTGLLADGVGAEHRVRCGGVQFAAARTFGDVPRGTALWYPNSSGLVELAVNQGSAAAELTLRVADVVTVTPP